MKTALFHHLLSPVWYLCLQHVDIDERDNKTHDSGPMIKKEALNSSVVLDETTEEGRLLQTGIVLGKNEFFRASLKANGIVYCDSCDARVRF